MWPPRDIALSDLKGQVSQVKEGITGSVWVDWVHVMAGERSVWEDCVAVSVFCT